MDIFLIILGVLCLLAGLAGCFLPVLPGPPVSYVGLLLLHFTDKIHFSTTHLILWAFLVIIVQVMDYVTPMLGTKYSGGGKWRHLEHNSSSKLRGDPRVIPPLPLSHG